MPSRLTSSVRPYVSVYQRFRTAGVTRASLVAYPFRRRLGRRENVLALRSGDVLRSDPDEPLLAMFEESWVDERYRPLGWTRTVELNDLKQVVVIPTAVGAATRQATMFRRGPEAMNTLFTHDALGSRFGALAEVDVVTIDDLFVSSDVERCDLLKLDCEGAEYEVLGGASRDTVNRVGAIVAEYHVGLNDGEPEWLASLLRAAGFDVTILPPMDNEGGHLHALRSA